MAYTDIDDPTAYFQSKLYTGTGSSLAITNDGNSNLQPDLVWLKRRDGSTYDHRWNDSVRGVSKTIYSSDTFAENTSDAQVVTSFDSNGFTLGTSAGSNASGVNNVAWQWSAGGTAPAITYSVKVVSDSGNKYRFDDFGTSAVTLDLQEGGTYTFDQSDSSNSGHPLRFSTTSDGTHGGGSEYTTNVTTTGTPGSAGAKTVITVASGTATLYYYCSSHSGMGGQANTNSTFGSSNFGGSIQTNVSANTTAGFSIVSYTGTGSNATIGHGLGSVPAWIITKNRDATQPWRVYHKGVDATAPEDYGLIFNDTSARDDDNTAWNDTAPTSSVFSVGSSANTNNSSDDFIAYCFSEKKGFSKFGSYTGNANSAGPFIFTGFKPAFFIYRNVNTSTEEWKILDNKRDPFNRGSQRNLNVHASSAESDDTNSIGEFLSNGVKIRSSHNNINKSGSRYIFIAFAESPFVTSTGIPTTAR